eukprot:c24480_g1_i1 orf=547-2334(-)
MGCASSKSLRKQAKTEDVGISSPTSLYCPQNQHFGDHHHHLVALTSSTYGLLKIDIPKPTEEATDKKGACVESLSEMLEKLRSLEIATESAPQSWNEVSCALEKIKPNVESSSSSSGKVWKSNYRSSQVEVAKEPETINVRDIMEGLEEDAPAGLSLVQIASFNHSKLSVPRKPKHFNSSPSFHTVEELDFLTGRSTARAGLASVTKEMKDPSDRDIETICSGISDQIGVDKENAPPASANQNLYGNNCAGASRKGSNNQKLFMQSQNCMSEKLTTTGKDRNSIKGKNTEGSIIFNGDVDSASPIYSTNKNTGLSLNQNHKDNLSSPVFLKKVLSTSHSLLDNDMRQVVYAVTSEIYTEPSSPLFDPELLASYEKALKNLSEDDWNSVQQSYEIKSISGNPISEGLTKTFPGNAVENVDTHLQILPAASELQREKASVLETFEKKCPPGGEGKLVLYTTTLRGIRKTFDDCNNVRGLLQSFGLSIDERDVSMHLEFRNEFRELLGLVTVPRLFIRGRYIGGAEEVAHFHEEGLLVELVEGLPAEVIGNVCDGCGGMRFVPCLECSGSCKIVNEENKNVRCPDCNENGLIQCPICS